MDTTGQPADRSTAIKVGAGGRVGDITIQGDVAGRDIIKVTEELTYDVSDLSANPYLGLASYTYATRAFYGGREQPVREGVARLTAPGEEPVLLFVTGASGSGKSSFAQAGLVPALEDSYAAQGCRVRWSVMRPGRRPIEALGRAMRKLDVAEPYDGDWASLLRTPEDLNHLLATQTPSTHVNVLIFDQFEELFTQADPAERDVTCALLSGLETFEHLRTHVIATLRADYLSALFDTPILLERFKQEGIELRAMSADELARAIRKPLQAQARLEGKDKRLDPGLVERLVADVGDDPSLLPLLQVTLRALWDEPPHRLVLERYRSLTHSLEQQANLVFKRNARGRERPPAEREKLMGVFLDLVEVSLDDDPRRDVRRTLPKHELLEGHSERAPLIEELVDARLVTTSVEHGRDGDVEAVDIIHETLLGNWPRLRDEIANRREALQQRERFRLALREWLQQGRRQDYLLLGVRLAEARSLAERNDVAVRDVDGAAFLQASNAAEAESRLLELRKARRRQRLLAGAAGVALVFAITAIVAASNAVNAQGVAEQQSTIARQQSTVAQQQTTLAQQETARAQSEASARATAEATANAQRDAADQAKNQAVSRELAARAVSELPADPELSVLLAERAVKSFPTASAESALRRSMLEAHPSKIMRGHTALVGSAAFSPDGRRVVSASRDASARVWSIDTGAPVFVLSHSGPVNHAVFSPDGRLILTAAADGTAKIWDAQTGALQATLQADPSGVNDAEFNPTSTRIVTAGESGSAQVWDTAGVPLFGLTGHTSAVVGATFSPDGSRIVSASADTTAILWNANGGKQQAVLAGHNGAVNQAVFSPDGMSVATASEDNTAVVWAANTSGTRATPQVTLNGHTAGVLEVSFSPDSSQIVTASSDATVSVWDAKQGVSLHTLEHDNNLGSAAFSHNGKWIVSTGADTTTRIWEASTGRELVRLPGQQGWGRSATFSPDDTLVLTANGDSAHATRWGPTPAARVTVLDGHTDIVDRVAFNRTGTELLTSLLTSSWDKTARLWDPATGVTRLTLKGHTGEIYVSNFNPDGTRVVTGSTDGTARVWDASTGRTLSVLKVGGVVNAVAFSPDGKVIVTAGEDGKARFWDATSFRMLATLGGHTGSINDAEFSADNSRLVTAGDDGQIGVWESPSGRNLFMLRGHTDRVVQAIFNTDSTRIASGSGDASARLWDAASGAPLFTLLGHSSVLSRGLAFTLQDGALVTGSEDATVRVWNTATGQLMTVLQGHTGPIQNLAVSSDGRWIVTASQDQTGRVWNMAAGGEPILLTGFKGWVQNATFSPDLDAVAAVSVDGTARMYAGCWLSCSLAALQDEAEHLYTRQMTQQELAGFGLDQ